jgi:hypothetical protein
MSQPHVHVFPVDESFLPGENATLAEFQQGMLEAWKEICNFGKRVTYTGGERWAELTCDGEECWRIEDKSAVS